MAVINLTGKPVKGLHSTLPIEEPMTDLSALVESAENLLDDVQRMREEWLQKPKKVKRKCRKKREKEPPMKVYRIEDLNVG